MRFILLLVVLTGSNAFADAAPKLCRNLISQDKLKVDSCETLKLIVLSGTGPERAYNFGSLLKQKVLSQEVLNYFSSRLLKPIQNNNPKFYWVAQKTYDLWARFFVRHIPEQMKNEVLALSRGSELPIDFFNRTVALPDTAVLLGVLRKPKWLHSLPEMGCTSVAIKFPKGDFLMARNLDFSGVGFWDQFPSAVVHLPPAESGELKHIAFGADGLFFSGISGVNEAGISFAVHQNYSTEASLEGIPMTFVGELVLQRAHSLAEAEALLSQYRPSPLWTFVVSDLKTGDAMSVESSVHRFYVRPMKNDHLVQTNHLQSPLTREAEIISDRSLNNSQLRMTKAEQMLLAGPSKGQTKPAFMANILSYQANPKGELSSQLDILKAHTIQSIIYEHQAGESYVYLSYEAAPAASGRYLRFRLSDFWTQKRPINYTILDLAKTPPDRRAVHMQFAHAFQKYFDEAP